jgi:hypothetical protein
MMRSAGLVTNTALGLKRLLRAPPRAILGAWLDARTRLLAARLRKRPRLRKPDDRPLRIGLLCAAWDQQHFGIAVWTRVLSRALAKAGHQVFVFQRVRRPVAVEVDAGVSIVSVVDASMRRWPPMPPVWPWLAAWERAVTDSVLRMHADIPFDIVSGPVWPVEPLALVRAAAVPVAVSLHTTQSVVSTIGGQEPEDLRAMAAAERDLLATASIIIANSRAVARDLEAARGEAFDASRLHVVPHGMPDMSGGDIDAAPHDGVRILYLGQLSFRKGIDTLLDAVPAVLAADRSVSIDIAGAAHDESPEPAFRLRHADAAWLDRVSFLGLVDPETKLALLRQTDVVVMPSRYESFGLVGVEAMMFGKPVVSTLAGGIPEVVAHQETGLLAPPGDPEALADALRCLVADPQLRRRFGAAGRTRYLTDFTDDAMAAAWVSAIRSALV